MRGPYVGGSSLLGDRATCELACQFHVFMCSHMNPSRERRTAHVSRQASGSILLFDDNRLYQIWNIVMSESPTDPTPPSYHYSEHIGLWLAFVSVTTFVSSSLGPGNQPEVRHL